MIRLTEKEQEARKMMCIALDVSIVKEAEDLTHELFDFFEMFKIGHELHISAGNEGVNIIERIHKPTPKERRKVFLDKKFDDIPNTVYKSSIASAVPGVYMFNVHISSGEETCKRAIEGAYEGARIRGIERPKVIGVTVLTSLDDEDLLKQSISLTHYELVRLRTGLAKGWGLDGVVCPANQAGQLEKEFGSDLIYVLPGMQWAGKKGSGQKHLYTPDLAVRECKNSIPIIGRAITEAENRREVAYSMLQAVSREL